VPLLLPEGTMAGQPLFTAIVDYYNQSSMTKPGCLVADFFTTAASDAADYLDVPAVTVFSYPCGIMRTEN
jgi:hypothetical protein